jgi:glycosyltransferase involved in cell wall biosynthesis
MKISVALCTYNGARFLEEQLRSLSSQTRLPDELIVCDDGSSDETLDIVSSFAERAPFYVSYARNELRLGVTKNFERAITQCTGDVIFLCDQDDFWMPEKISTLMGVFEGDECIGLVFSDAIVTDSQLSPSGYTMWETVKLTPKRQLQMNRGEGLGILVRRHVVTGATLAFRASLRQHILPIPSRSFHDAWAAAVSAMRSKIVAIKTPLILYRQHDANVIGGIRMTRLAQLMYALQLKPEWFDLEIEQGRSLRDKMREAGWRTANGKHLADLERRIVHLESRRAMYGMALWPRVLLIAREVLAMRYSLFSRGLRSALLDLVTKGKGRRPGTHA